VKSGTPGFVGERLRQGREARSLTITALADLTGVTKAAVSQYENGIQSPRPEVMRRIEEVLNLPPLFFLRPVPTFEHNRIFYRSRKSATKTERARAEKRHGWWKEIIEYLRSFVKFPAPNFPAPNLPQFAVPEDPNEISEEQIEVFAQKTREFWQLADTPISNCCWLLENQGAIVTHGRLGSETLDSFSEWDAETPYVFLGSEKTSAVRGRLNAAHELGHLILHRQVLAKHHENPEDHQLMERHANEFAGAFLLPARAFAREMHAPTLDSFYRLKPKWKVAISAMIMRAEKLGFISDSDYRRMWITLARKGWKTREPLDETLEVEKPRICRNAIDLVISEGVLTKADLLEQGFASQDDIEALMCLPKGYLAQSADPERSPVVQLKDRQPIRTAAAKSTASKVLQFRST
jgi:Zn-dependent peptidase ImmA (M78 family)/transcriptional regulator with XRE-family HTH domain